MIDGKQVKNKANPTGTGKYLDERGNYSYPSVITGADSGILADFTGSTTNTIVKTFATLAGLFNAKNSFWLRLSVIKWNSTGACTVRVYFNTTESITDGNQVLLSTSVIPIGNTLANISKTMAFLPFSSSAYIMSLVTANTFVDFLTLTNANVSSVTLSSSAGFFIVAFQNTQAGERTMLSSFNLSKI
jgi:hypothetical protein